MKKQVTFARSHSVHRLHRDQALPRNTGMNQSKIASKDGDLKINRPSAARTEPELQHVTVIQIPKSMAAAPFLKHAALTPAQREYLYTIASSYSTAHVRNIITQHYMNVLHRCVRAGYSRDRDDLSVTSVTSPENEGENRQSKPQSEVSSRAKHKGKINTGVRHPGKSFLPQIPNRQARTSNTSASKHRKMKKRTSPTLRRKSQRVRIRLLEEEEEEEEEEEGLDDFLSESLSSLSVGEWDDDTVSDL
ncbi:uncharacterized protein LOC121196898 [Toxotes jaculatrix]|uniref:uncharacterized protein LOC121196898 n=1 Tax=Toxotes jaculatrix TaxID=941984 RepID=UPI001B3AE25B|nr:uncharacterized protein LOC121196898 [Toxotes jaculatrix]